MAFPGHLGTSWKFLQGETGDANGKGEDREKKKGERKGHVIVERGQSPV